MVWIFVLLMWALYWAIPTHFRWIHLIILCTSLLFWFSANGLLVLVVVWLLTYFGRRFPTVLIVLLVGNLLFWKVWLQEAVLGLSFVTFFLIHYVVDYQRRKLPEHSVLQLGARIFFLPILTAGPIERFQHFLTGQQDKPLWYKASYTISLGIIQKWILGEGLVAVFLNGWTGSVLAEQGLYLSPPMLWSVLGGLFLQLYCDFAGYSNFAIGISALFGFSIAENFSSPLLATNPAEFWKRWHISLSSWCQEYVYMPILGLTRNPYAGITGTFLVMGLWHSVSWHWVLWGVSHAFVLMMHLTWKRVCRSWGFRDTWVWTILSWVMLMMFLSLTSCLTQVSGYAGIDVSARLFLRAFGVQ